MEGEHQSQTPSCFGAPAPLLSIPNSRRLRKYDNTPYLDIVHNKQNFFMYYWEGLNISWEGQNIVTIYCSGVSI